MRGKQVTYWRRVSNETSEGVITINVMVMLENDTEKKRGVFWVFIPKSNSNKKLTVRGHVNGHDYKGFITIDNPQDPEEILRKFFLRELMPQEECLEGITVPHGLLLKNELQTRIEFVNAMNNPDYPGPVTDKLLVIFQKDNWAQAIPNE
jgi:hypothetical protein